MGLFSIRRALAWLRFNRTFRRRPGVLQVGPDGVEFQQYHFRNGEAVLETDWRFAWSDVSGILGYKIDAFAVDQIRVAFQVRAANYVVTEDMIGFKELTAEIGARFNCPFEAWFHQVAFPPFATNWTTIWKRPGTTPV